MQRILKYFFVIFMLGSAVSIPVKKASAQQVSFQIFYDQLSPYGHWVNFPDEGYVWVPAVDAGFSPYQTNGYWVYTDYGWTWVSDYQWGWAPFHYGRWDFDDDYGWYWVPEYEWAPAWVAWSRAPGYYGWAPLRPGVDVDGAITSGYYVPYEHWCYVHEGYLGRRDINRYYAPRSENMEHVRNSRMINRTNIDQRHTTYMGGPPREDVEKSTGAPLKQLVIAPRSTPGQSVAPNKVSIYKPVVAPLAASNQKPAPPTVASLRDLKPLPGRTPNPERLNAGPPATTSQPTQPKANPVNIPQPKSNQTTEAATQTAPQNTRTSQPQQRQQPSPMQQTAPRENPVQQNAPRDNPRQQNRQTPPSQQAAPKETPQQVQPPQQRAPRYAPPKYNSPRPYTPPPQSPPQQHAAQPPQAPPQQHAEPPHQAPPPSVPQPHAPPQAPPQQHAPPPQQDGKPHR